MNDLSSSDRHHVSEVVEALNVYGFDLDHPEFEEMSEVRSLSRHRDDDSVIKGEREGGPGSVDMGVVYTFPEGKDEIHLSMDTTEVPVEQDSIDSAPESGYPESVDSFIEGEMDLEQYCLEVCEGSYNPELTMDVRGDSGVEVASQDELISRLNYAEEVFREYEKAIVEETM